MGKYRIGIDVGGTKVAYGLFDEEFKLIKKQIEKSRTDLDVNDQIELLISQTQSLIDSAGISKAEVKGIGAAFPGHIDFKLGMIISVSNLGNWSHVPIRDIFNEKMGLPVYVDNDANVAALCEFKLGAAKGKTDNMAYITISTGIGGGIIVNGALMRGQYGAAGEVGHIIVDPTIGIICGCGRVGCIETLASGTGMTKYVKMRIAQGVKSIIPALAGNEPISPYYIHQAFIKGDNLAIETFDFVSDKLGVFFNNMYQLFNLSMIVYGGGVTKIGSDLMDKIIAKTYQYVPMAKEYPMTFERAMFGDEVGVYGAALLVE